MNFKRKTYFCPYCAARVRRVGGTTLCECGHIVPEGKGWELDVSGTDAKEVHTVIQSLIDDMYKREKPITPRSPWASGSFYLSAIVILGVLFLVIAKVVPILALPIVIIGALLACSTVGAFQLRQDKNLSEKNFLSLMFLTFRQLPFVGRSRK